MKEEKIFKNNDIKLKSQQTTDKFDLAEVNICNDKNDLVNDKNIVIKILAMVVVSYL